MRRALTQVKPSTRTSAPAFSNGFKSDANEEEPYSTGPGRSPTPIPSPMCTPSAEKKEQESRHHVNRRSRERGEA